jgi:hypothetical protein
MIPLEGGRFGFFSSSFFFLIRFSKVPRVLHKLRRGHQKGVLVLLSLLLALAVDKERLER